MKLTVTGILLYVLLLSFASCKKNKPGHDHDPAPAILSVKLGTAYLPVAQVDSAFAIWKVNGQEQRIKMAVSNDSLLTSMSQFNEGSGQLVLHIFSKKKFGNQYFGQFVSKKTVSLQKNKALNYAGPSSFNDVSWFPRVELKDAIGHEAVVALRPDDPYFLVKDPGHEMYQYSVDRGYWKTVGGIALAGRDVWRCQTGCADVPNEQFFTSLPQRIGSKPWNHISIAVLFETSDGEGWVVSLEYEP